jgi:hypothetical protein
MKNELILLMKKYNENPVVLDIYNGIRHKIEIYRQYSDYFGYEFFIMRKIS